MYPDSLFEIFGQGVHAYGICMAVGIIACFGFLMFTMWYKKFNEEATDKILLIGLFGTGFGIFAAILFQSFYNWLEDTSKPFTLGGMTFIGGLIGGVASFLGVYFLYIYVIAPRTKIKFLQNNMNATLTDALPFIPIGIAIAHAFGRLGCFFGGCCFGYPAEWGLPQRQRQNRRGYDKSPRRKRSAYTALRNGFSLHSRGRNGSFIFQIQIQLQLRRLRHSLRHMAFRSRIFPLRRPRRVNPRRSALSFADLEYSNGAFGRRLFLPAILRARKAYEAPRTQT